MGTERYPAWGPAFSSHLHPLQFTAVPEPVSIQQAMLAYDLTCTRHGDRLRFSRSVRLHAGTLPAAKFAGWLRALANADRADQCSIELAKR